MRMSSARKIALPTLMVALVTVISGCSSAESVDTVPASPQVELGDTAEATASAAPTTAAKYPIVDTGQGLTYGMSTVMEAPEAGEALYGQDAQHDGNQPSYTDNGDGTINDNVTGLVWTKTPDLNGDGSIDDQDKLTYAQAVSSTSAVDVGGFDDWRLPSVDELYSLILFAGQDVSSAASVSDTYEPFIDSDYFDFGYGDLDAGDRVIDAQVASSTTYVDTSGPALMFGLNFADGRIKGYPTQALPGQSEAKGYYVYYVRGNTRYGDNEFTDNGDGTVTDTATSLMWAQGDSGVGMDWEAALDWAQEANASKYLGYSDWRVPNAKELQSLVDYSLSPGTSGTAAIDPVFSATPLTNEAGEEDYGMYWTSTTHLSINPQSPAGSAVYVAFGSAMGYMNNQWVDIHGAGAQRSDPKQGDAADYPEGHGPQGDAIRIDNLVRLVRDA